MMAEATVATPAATVAASAAIAAAPAIAAKLTDAAPAKTAAETLLGEPTKAEGDKAKPETKVGAPEKYADFKLPEGVEVDPKAMAAFAPVAKELGLSQEQAQKLVDLQTNVLKQSAEAQQEAWNGILKGWHDESKADKEIGGAGFDANIALAVKTLTKFGTPELRAALDATGTGNHPEFIRLLVRVGNAIGEDKLIVGGNPAGATKTMAETMFPNQVK
jgi:hypothetical protein